MGTTYPVHYNLHQTLIEMLPTAVILLDTENNYVCSNPAFLVFSQLDPSLLTATGWSLCLDSLDKKSLYHVLSEMKNSVTTCVKKTLQVRLNKSGSFFTTIAITAFKTKMQDWYFLLTFIKVDNQAIQSQFETEEYIASLEASNELKDKILAIISHDLRGPVNSLKSLSSDFFDDELSKEERSLIKENLMSQLNSVSDLTENLLRWASKSFLNKTIVKTEAIYIYEIVEQNIALTRHHAQSKNIKINCQIPRELMVSANKDHIDIVIRNIVTNAIKYTPLNGRIDILGADTKPNVQISVTDTGIGLNSEQLKKLFTYAHSNSYGTSGEKGIGLGLLLCKEFIESSGGNISITSEVNLGTTVTIELLGVRPAENIYAI